RIATVTTVAEYRIGPDYKTSSQARYDFHAACEIDAAYIASCHPEAIRALLAERDALRTAQQWQPIETAPKDGTWIMAYRPPCEGVQMDTILMVSWQPFDDEGSAWMWPD